jgi:hypothetical protein
LAVIADDVACDSGGSEPAIDETVTVVPTAVPVVVGHVSLPAVPDVWLGLQMKKFTEPLGVPKPVAPVITAWSTTDAPKVTVLTVAVVPESRGSVCVLVLCCTTSKHSVVAEYSFSGLGSTT